LIDLIEDLFDALLSNMGTFLNGWVPPGYNAVRRRADFFQFFLWG